MRDVLLNSIRIGTWLLVCALIGCGNGGGEQPQLDTGAQLDTGSQPDTGNPRDGGSDATADATPDVASDATSPEFRDVRISIGGGFSAEIDLRDQDVSQILPTAANAAFKLFVRDDTSSAEELVVEIVDAEGNPLTPTDGPTFRNGLWHVEVEIGPGVSARPKVSDSAGNTAHYGAALVVPPRADAVIDQWRTMLYDAQIEIQERWLSEFGADRSWEQSQDVDGGWSRGGTFEFDQENLVLTQTYGPGDSDEDSADWQEAGEYYVDETYFARQPLRREGTGDDLVGTWSYVYERHENSGNGLESQGTHTVSVHFDSDGTWQETLGTTDAGSEQTRSGTWTVETNDGYAANFGDFLIRTTTEADGETLQSPIETSELFVIRQDHLLLSPRIRGHGQ